MSHTDKSFFNTLTLIIGALVIFMLLAMVTANKLSATSSTNENADSMAQEAIAERIAPVGKVNTDPVKTASAGAAAPASGGIDAKAIYQSACFACHGTGAAGAPKLGDKGAWKARIAQGMDTLVSHAIKGFKGSKGFMPAKGGRADLSDDTVTAVVKYMAKNSK